MSAMFDTFKDIANARAEAIRARDARLEQKAIEEARRFKVPPLGEGQISYMWSTDCEVDIECHLDYSPEEPAQHYGDAPYPGYPEDVSLRAAYLRGVDIYELLSEKQINQIEEGALIQISEDRSGGRYE